MCRRSRAGPCLGAAGEPYADKMLALPGFLRGLSQLEPTTEDILAGFALTGYFLNRHVFEPRGVTQPDARERVISRLARFGN